MCLGHVHSHHNEAPTKRKTITPSQLTSFISRQWVPLPALPPLPATHLLRAPSPPPLPAPYAAGTDTLPSHFRGRRRQTDALTCAAGTGAQYALLPSTLPSHFRGRTRQTDALAAGTGARRFFDATASRTKNSSSETFSPRISRSNSYSHLSFSSRCMDVLPADTGAQRSTTLFFHRLFFLTSAAGTGKRMHSRPAQARGASSMLPPHGPKTLLPNNFHLASLVATLTPICRFLRDAWMRSRPAQAHSAAQSSSSIRVPHGPNSSSE